MRSFVVSIRLGSLLSDRLDQSASGNPPYLSFSSSNAGDSMPIGRPVVQRFSPIHF